MKNIINQSPKAASQTIHGFVWLLFTLMMTGNLMAQTSTQKPFNLPKSINIPKIVSAILIDSINLDATFSENYTDLSSYSPPSLEFMFFNERFENKRLMIPTSDSGFIILTHKNKLRKYDKNLFVVWENSYGGTIKDDIKDVKETENGYILIIQNFSKDGQLLNTGTYADGRNPASDNDKGADGSNLYKTKSAPDIWIVLIDKIGNIKDSKVIGSEAYENPIKLLKTPNGYKLFFKSDLITDCVEERINGVHPSCKAEGSLFGITIKKYMNRVEQINSLLRKSNTNIFPLKPEKVYYGLFELDFLAGNRIIFQKIHYLDELKFVPQNKINEIAYSPSTDMIVSIGFTQGNDAPGKDGQPGSTPPAPFLQCHSTYEDYSRLKFEKDNTGKFCNTVYTPIPINKQPQKFLKSSFSFLDNTGSNNENVVDVFGENFTPIENNSNGIELASIQHTYSNTLLYTLNKNAICGGKPDVKVIGKKMDVIVSNTNNAITIIGENFDKLNQINLDGKIIKEINNVKCNQRLCAIIGKYIYAFDKGCIRKYIYDIKL